MYISFLKQQIAEHFSVESVLGMFVALILNFS